MVHLVFFFDPKNNGYSIWMDHWKNDPRCPVSTIAQSVSISHQDSALKDVPDLTPGDLHREYVDIYTYTMGL